MSNRPLVEQLEFWRAERPDEWTMDELIRDAQKLEGRIIELQQEVEKQRSRCNHYKNMAYVMAYSHGPACAHSVPESVPVLSNKRWLLRS